MVFLLVFGIGIALLGLAWILLTLRARRRQQGTGNWPYVTGTVLSASIYEHTRVNSDGAITRYTPLVSYSYSVDNQAYVGRRLAFRPYDEVSYGDRLLAQRELDPYPVGSQVKVYYNPQAPDQASLRIPRPAGQRLVLWYGIMNVTLGVLMAALYFVAR